MGQLTNEAQAWWCLAQLSCWQKELSTGVKTDTAFSPRIHYVALLFRVI